MAHLSRSRGHSGGAFLTRWFFRACVPAAIGLCFLSPLLRPERPKPRPRPGAVVHRKVVAAGVRMDVVQVDLNSPEIRVAVATAKDGIGSREDWSAILGRTRPAAAVTGTYFCTQTAVPVGTIVVGGQPVHTGLVGTAFTFRAKDGARLASCRPRTAYRWKEWETVLGGGTRLLTGGRLTLWPRAEGFRDPSIFRAKRRTAVALTRERKLLLVAVRKPVLMRTLAAGLKGLGALDAMCLDGGQSAGLYHKGKTWVKPGRMLTNLLVVYDTSAQYQEFAKTLVPGPQVVQAPEGEGPG
jgi:phosphodiester glycosidase